MRNRWFARKKKWQSYAVVFTGLLFVIYGMFTISSMFISSKNVFITECRRRLRAQIEQQAARQVYVRFGYAMVDGEKERFPELLWKELPMVSYLWGRQEPEVETEDEFLYMHVLEEQAFAENKASADKQIKQEDKSQENTEEAVAQEIEPAQRTKQKVLDEANLRDVSWLKKNFYTIDGTTSVTDAQLSYEALAHTDMKITKGEEPQILIFHTHSQECFVDSKQGDAKTSIVAVGEYLASLLQDTYGYQVLHNKKEYDMVNGKLDRNKAYSLALPDIEAILKKNPSIQVILDIHSDGVRKGQHFVENIDGKPTARVMFFNGLSYLNALGNIPYLKNENLQGNMAFSFQLQCAAEEYFPGYARKIYLKGYRYNLHLLARSVVIEVGAQTNTLEEEMNAMEPLAFVLNQVLSGKQENE